jgi:hypothetical protein
MHAGVEVLRRLSPAAAEDLALLSRTTFFADRMRAGQVVGTEQLDPDNRSPVTGEASWPVVLRHERIPFVSYPYEWSFSQLQDAAALHIDLLLDALGEGMTMKDGYAYNLQFRGAMPLFIDIGSFEQYRGGPWAGYRQFCQTFLFRHRAPDRDWTPDPVAVAGDDHRRPDQHRALGCCLQRQLRRDARRCTGKLPG